MISKEILLELNKNYYRAFENFDLQLMSQVWANTNDVVCIHPGWDILVGWEKVREGWNKIFMDDSLLKFTIRNSNTIILNNIGIVSCIEEILFLRKILFRKLLLQRRIFSKKLKQVLNFFIIIVHQF
jgi:hypothetical protein